MSFLSRFFRRPDPAPGYALYCDRGKRGAYSCRLVPRDDRGIMRGKPERSVWMMPINMRFDTPGEAASAAILALDEVGVTNGHLASCYCEEPDDTVMVFFNPGRVEA